MGAMKKISTLKRISALTILRLPHQYTATSSRGASLQRLHSEKAYGSALPDHSTGSPDHLPIDVQSAATGLDQRARNDANGLF
jgi:hypothetical protein